MRTVVLTAIALTLVASLHASNAVPDWVRAAAAQTLPPFPTSTRAAVLLDDTTYTVGADGRATLHVRRVVKILRPQGRDDAQPFVTYDKDSKILSMHVWSIDPAGHEYTIKDNEVADLGAPGEGGQLYSDERVRVATTPGRDAGGVVAYEYERRERPYLAETNWSFQGDLPRLAQSFTLVLPAGFTYNTTWAHHERIAASKPGENTYRWERNHEAGIDLEQVPLSPNTGALAGRMTVHYSGPGLAAPQEGTWRGIGEWYDTLSRDRLVASPEIAAKAVELTSGKADFYAKAEALGEFVQQHIRYFAVEMGIGGYQPHSAGEVFRGRYGD